MKAGWLLLVTQKSLGRGLRGKQLRKNDPLVESCSIARYFLIEKERDSFPLFLLI